MSWHTVTMTCTKTPYRWQLIFEHKMNGDDLPEWQSDRIDTMTGMLEHLLQNSLQNVNQQKSFKRRVSAGVHGITLLSVDDKFFAAEPIDGKQLIENLLSNYLKIGN